MRETVEGGKWANHPSRVVSLFFLNPSKDLNNQIDAPAETEEELYGK